MTFSVGLRRTAAMSLLAPTFVPAPSPKTRPTEDELDGNTDDVETTQKPTRLGTNGLKPLPLDGRYFSATEGSLPSTPDPQELDSAELKRDTRQILLDFYRTHTGMCPVHPKEHPALPTMRRVVGDILVKHQIAYKGMLHRLKMDSPPDSLDFVSCIARSIFKDGTTNWGRVASLVAFGATVCSRLIELKQDECVETVAELISSYLITEQHDWMLKNKGWLGFVEFFHVEDVESGIRNTLMAMLGVAGIGAGLSLLMR